MGKKEALSKPPANGKTLGNVKVFPETVSKCALLYEEFEALTTTQSDYRNSVAKNSAPLLVEPIQNHNNLFNNNKVNPEHPRAPFYQRLKDSQGTYDLYIDNVTSWHDNSSSEDKEGMVEPKAPTNPSSICFVEEDTQAYKEGWDDRDNNPDSHIYDGFDNRYHRYVSNTTDLALTDDKQCVALVSSLYSLASNVEHNKMHHSAKCAKCSKKQMDQIDLLADSAASLHFTNQGSNLSEYEVVKWNEISVMTAFVKETLTVKGKGAMFLSTSEEKKWKMYSTCTLSSIAKA